MTQGAFGEAYCSLWGRTLVPFGIPWVAVWSNFLTFYVMLYPHRFVDDFGVDFERVPDPKSFDFVREVFLNLNFTGVLEILHCTFGMHFGSVLGGHLAPY